MIRQFILRNPVGNVGCKVTIALAFGAAMINVPPFLKLPQQPELIERIELGGRCRDGAPGHSSCGKWRCDLRWLQPWPHDRFGP
jgi:hypothetical protein